MEARRHGPPYFFSSGSWRSESKCELHAAVWVGAGVSQESQCLPSCYHQLKPYSSAIHSQQIHLWHELTYVFSTWAQGVESLNEPQPWGRQCIKAHMSSSGAHLHLLSLYLPGVWRGSTQQPPGSQLWATCCLDWIYTHQKAWVWAFCCLYLWNMCYLPCSTGYIFTHSLLLLMREVQVIDLEQDSGTANFLGKKYCNNWLLSHLLATHFIMLFIEVWELIMHLFFSPYPSLFQVFVNTIELEQEILKNISHKFLTLNVWGKSANLELLFQETDLWLRVL